MSDSKIDITGNVAFKRGNSEKNKKYTGPDGSISIDNEKNKIKIHNGDNPGGFDISSLTNKIENFSLFKSTPSDIIKDIFIYDTTKDSDGGAWINKCQNTSWYNEEINKTWLGIHPNYIYALYKNAKISEELNEDPFFNNISKWELSLFTIINNIAIRNNNPNAGAVATYFSFKKNKTYKISVTLSEQLPSFSPATTLNFGSVYCNLSIKNNPANVTSLTRDGKPGDILDFYLTPTVDTNYLSIYSSVNTYTNFSKISIKEVLSLNYESGDYYQDSSDGRFYKVYKNLISNSNNFTDSSWIKQNCSISETNFLLPDKIIVENKKVFLFTEGGANSGHSLRQNFSLIQGIKYTIGCYFKNSNRRFVALGSSNYNNFNVIFDLQTLLFTKSPNTEANIKDLGDGWFFCNFSFIANTTTQSNISIGSANNINGGEYITDGNTDFYFSNFSLSIGSDVFNELKTLDQEKKEVFRGNKRSFPKLSAIVATSNRIIIYDITENNTSMWMVFNSGVKSILNWTGRGENINCVFGLNSILGIGGSAAEFVNYTKDFIRLGDGPKYILGGAELNKTSISSRNDSVGYSVAKSGYTLINDTIYDIDMTVLPDAPIDPVTGLQVPTIAVATMGGVSVIQHSGTVKNIGTANRQATVSLVGKEMLVSGVNGSNYGIWYCPDITDATPTVAQYFASYGTQLGMTAPNEPSSSVSVKNTLVSRPAGARGLRFMRRNPTRALSVLVSAITNTFNTGWMTGDIRRTYLADVGAGAVTGGELVTNGAFDANISGWNQSGSAVLAWSAGALRMTATEVTAYSGAWQQLPLTVAERRRVRITFTLSAAASGAQVYVVGTNGGATEIFGGYFTSAGTYTLFGTTAPGGNNFVQLIFNVRRSAGNASIGDWVEIDNVSVQEVVEDRSYRAQGANIVGTLTKTPVATGAQLVAYSGFNQENYLQEKYSSDLDFNLTDFNINVWVNTRDGNNNVNLISNPENASLAWCQFGSIQSNVEVAPDGTMTADKLVSGTSMGMVHYSAGVISGIFTLTIRAKPAGYPRMGVRFGWDGNSYLVHATVDLLTGQIVTNRTNAKITVSEPDVYGYRTCSFTGLSTRNSYNTNNNLTIECHSSNSTAQADFVADGVSGIIIWGVQLNPGEKASTYTPELNTINNPKPGAVIFSREGLTGAFIRLFMDGYGFITAQIHDGVLYREVTTTHSCNNMDWVNVSVNYTLDGTLNLTINDRNNNNTYGIPLNNFSNQTAQLTIGNHFNTNNPFPGSLCLLRISSTCPTPEQASWIYNQEKMMFYPNTKITLPDDSTVVDLDYNEDTDTWVSCSSKNVSYFNGLVRTKTIPINKTLFTKIKTKSNILLIGKTSEVDINKEEISFNEKETILSNLIQKNKEELVTFEYNVGFSGLINSGNTNIAITTGSIKYPTSFISAKIYSPYTNNAIIKNAKINNTELYISAKASSQYNGSFSFIDFYLPVGYTIVDVYLQGILKYEGPTKDWIRLFDGFREACSFNTVPNSSDYLVIKAKKAKI